MQVVYSFTDKLKHDIPESCQTITLLSPNEKLFLCASHFSLGF